MNVENLTNGNLPNEMFIGGLSKKHRATGYKILQNDALPEHLKVNPYFIKVLAMDKDKLFAFLLNALSGYGYEKLYSFNHSDDGYIFAKGTLPVCLCAHIDKVPHYRHVKKVHRSAILDKKGDIVDVYLSSKQGIGGDDRCGVYAILCMLKLGFRPSVFFCDGEEIGCRGSRKFCVDFPKEFLSDVNAFIQIDRRGNGDCVRYSDDNPDLTNAIEPFGFKHAWGSCSDISVLMPHFGISGVNLSSGYYHEHNASLEYVSVFDVNHLILRLKKILGECDFSHRYEYRSRSYCSSYDSPYRRPFFFDEPDPIAPASHGHESHKQLSLLSDPNFNAENVSKCDCCGELTFTEELVEIEHPDYVFVCPDCARDRFLKQGWIRCPACKNLYRKTTTDADPSFLQDSCPFCGSFPDGEDF